MWTKMTLATALLSGSLAITNPLLAQGAGIHVFESSYGLPGRVMQVTGLVIEECGGRSHCAFPVRNEFFGGDPFVGPRKQVVVYGTAAAAAYAPPFRNIPEAALHC